MSPARKKDAPPARETDLFPPVRDFLVEQGYTIRSEVKGCDITATREEELLVIELKRRFSTDLLIQAAERQRLTDSVYVAIPASAIPGGREGRTRWKGMQLLLRRLEVGLLLVSSLRGKPRVEILFHPLPYERKHSSRGKRAVLREITGRSADYNVGGSTRRKLCTAYREVAVHIACCLEQRGPLRPRDLRALGTGPKTLSILNSNFYGWFERVERGVYSLKPQGGAALAEYPELVEHFRAALAKSGEL